MPIGTVMYIPVFSYYFFPSFSAMAMLTWHTLAAPSVSVLSPSLCLSQIQTCVLAACLDGIKPP